MRIPVVCITCGCPLGHLEDIFRHLRAKRVRSELEARGLSPAQAGIAAGLQIECGDILDGLGIVYACCRKTLATASCFEDYA